MLNPISEENQDKLVSTLSKAMDYYNAGSTPSEAVAKSASDAGLNSNFTKRCTEMFNAAVTIDHFDSYRMNSEKRASSFPIADYPTVWKLMGKRASSQGSPRSLGNKVKDHTGTISTIKPFDWGIGTAKAASESSIPEEDGTLTTKIRREGMLKAAAIAKYNEKLERRDALVRSLRERRAEYNTKMAAARLQYYADKERLVDAVDVLANKFKKVDAPSWDAFYKAANNTCPGYKNWLDYINDKHGISKVASPRFSRGVDGLSSALQHFKLITKHVDTAAKSAAAMQKLAVTLPGGLKWPEDEAYTDMRASDFDSRMKKIKGLNSLLSTYAEDPVLSAIDGKTVKNLYDNLHKFEDNAIDPFTIRGYLRRAVDSSPVDEAMSLDTADLKNLKDTFKDDKKTKVVSKSER